MNNKKINLIIGIVISLCLPVIVYAAPPSKPSENGGFQGNSSAIVSYKV